MPRELQAARLRALHIASAQGAVPHLVCCPSHRKHAARYDTINPTAGKRTGDLILSNLDFDVDDGIVYGGSWYCVGAALAATLGAAAIMVLRRRVKEPVGTRRLPAVIARFDETAAGMRAASLAPATAQLPSAVAVAQAADASAPVVPGAPWFPRINLSWSRLTYSTPAARQWACCRRGASGSTSPSVAAAPLLNALSGRAFAGTLTAVITHGHGIQQAKANADVGRALLTLLARRPVRGTVGPKSTVSANGAPLTTELARGHIAITYNDDPLQPYETVREALHVSASLRVFECHKIHRGTKYDQAAWVASVLQMCELEHVQTMSIEQVAAADPSALARVRIAVEAASNPSVLLVEDPLATPRVAHDAAGYRSILRSLRRVADSGRTVVVTLHSANADVLAVARPETVTLLGVPAVATAKASPATPSARMLFTGSLPQLQARLRDLNLQQVARPTVTASHAASHHSTAAADASHALFDMFSVFAALGNALDTAGADAAEAAVEAAGSNTPAATSGPSGGATSAKLVADEEDGMDPDMMTPAAAMAPVSPASPAAFSSGTPTPLTISVAGDNTPALPVPPAHEGFAASFAFQLVYAAYRQLRAGMRNLKVNRMRNISFVVVVRLGHARMRAVCLVPVCPVCRRSLSASSLRPSIAGHLPGSSVSESRHVRFQGFLHASGHRLLPLHHRQHPRVHVAPVRRCVLSRVHTCTYGWLSVTAHARVCSPVAAAHLQVSPSASLS